MTQERSAGASWGTFLIVLIAGIAYSISLMAIPTAMIYVADTFGGDMVGAGWLMSWNSVAGTILALFTATIQSKIGPKNMIIIALACILVSDVMVVMTTDITIAFVGRFIFGFANGLIATAGPTFVTILFSDPTKRGMPNAIWTMWIALGGVLINFLAPFLMVPGEGTNFLTGGPNLDWHPLFWFGIAFAAVALVLVIVGVRVPKAELMAAVAGSDNVKISDAFKNGYVWLCFVMVLCFAFSFSCYTSEVVAYLQAAVGMDPAAAQSWNGILNIIGIAAGLIIGFILNKVSDHTKALVAIFVLTVAACLAAFAFSTVTLAICSMFFFGLAVNMVMPAIFTNVQWVSKSPAVIAAAFGICAIASNGGGIPAAPVMGAMIEAGVDWFMLGVPPAVVSAVGLVCAIVFSIKLGRTSREGIAAAREADGAK